MLNDDGQLDRQGLEDVGFCLQQAFVWLSRCFELADRDYRALHGEEAARRDAAIANGVAEVHARINMTGRTVHYVLALDEGLNGALEIPLFNQGFLPGDPPK